MRKYIADHLHKDEYLIHADMFNTKRFPTDAKVINVGLGENNLLNIAGGLASQGKTVYVYGVAGFIIHRLEQLKFSAKHFGAKFGKIVIFNAGAIGYKDFGIGHELDDDYEICEMLNIRYFDPYFLKSLEKVLEKIDQKDKGIFYIRLGRDFDNINR